VVAAGGIVGLLHAVVLFMMAARLWRTPSAERAWQYVVIAGLTELLDRSIDFVAWGRFATTLNAVGQLHRGLELAQLAIAVVVLPLVLLLARGTESVPKARLLH
jgi:hypothetical protein